MPHATEDIKWGKDLVFSVGGKMFACLSAEGGSQVSFKATPENFRLLTQTAGIIHAPYAARFHWVLVTSPKALPDAALRELLRESHQLAYDRLPAKTRGALASGAGAKRSARRG